jgi:AAA family ATP:ADP antiporter|tara:strand:+ start:48 stop:1289 length:1242 start_codon:yes stop_codon:yes gene_type:complete
MNDYLNTLKQSFSRDSFSASLFFFFILSSWYTLRPLRNELAVQDIDNISILLAMVGIAMLFANFIYSWTASKTNLKQLIIFCYLFLASNLIVFINLDFSSNVWIGRSFYVWCNIYSFFVVAIFWVVAINLFRQNKARQYFGFISFGGTLGAAFGSRLSKYIANNYSITPINGGPEEVNISVFAFFTLGLLIIGLLIGLYCISRAKSEKIALGGTAKDAFKNLFDSRDVRLLAFYMFLFTSLMTIHWITSAIIFEDAIESSVERVALFADIELAVSLIAGFTQIFLTSYIVQRLGIKLILFSYGVIFSIVFSVYAFAPLLISAVLVTIILRVFEYSINKPTREIVFSHLSKNKRYKSSVLVDTFFARLGDFSGSIFLGLFKGTQIAFSVAPLAAIPFAIVISIIGKRVSRILQN